MICNDRLDSHIDQSGFRKSMLLAGPLCSMAVLYCALQRCSGQSGADCAGAAAAAAAAAQPVSCGQVRRSSGCAESAEHPHLVIPAKIT